MKFPVIAISTLSFTFLQAAPVSVGDHSFEGNSLASGGWSNNLSPEWQETGGPNNGGGFEEFITGFSAQGTDHLGMNPGHIVWQDLGVTYQANTRYTLTVAAGNRSSQTNNGNLTTYILSEPGGTTYATGSMDASTLAGDSFADAPDLVFDTPNDPSSIGKTIRIRLVAGGSGRSHFDNIRLDAAPLSMPDTADISTNAATSITATTATLNGIINDIGASAPVVTFFYGTTDGGVTPGNWDHTINMAGTQTGSFSQNITGLTPATQYFFTARATNSAGDSWALPVLNFETAAMAPTIANLPAANITATAADLGANVTNTGGDNPTVTIYYGTTDGGTNAASWANSTSLGTQSGSATSTVGSLTHSTTYFFRAYAQNSAGNSWATSSGTFSTATVTAPAITNNSPNGVTGSTASLRGEVTDTGFDTPTVTIFYGTTDGGTNPANWDSSENLGPVGGNFSRFVTGLNPLTTYYYTARATNAAGSTWASPAISFTTTDSVASAVVINEIHYDPADETKAIEFIELHNPSDTAIDVSGYQLTDAVEYTIPPGTSIPPFEYLVIGENPAALNTEYGITALGPWVGSLNNDGEEIDLRNPGGTIVDQVNYGSGFPWPTGARGGGGSMVLISPDLDNDLGGSWRTSGAELTPPPSSTYITAADSNWHYRKGTSEASNPVNEWRNISFTEDGTWLTGQTPIGYGDGDDNTVLSDMQSNYSTVYLRHEFTVDPLDIPQNLTLRVYVDDGAVIWINGQEIDRLHANGGHVPFNGTGLNHEAEWETINISNANTFLVGGTNVLAIHALNTGNNSSDFSIDASLEAGITGGGGASATPTPGAANFDTTPPLPPAIRQVNHTPNEPSSSDNVIITAKITDPDGVGPVTLDYQLVNPGNYIRRTDASYDTSWTTLTMVDDGSGNDTLAGDSIYTATLPASLQTHRRLVRYRIHFEDSLGNSATAPYPDDDQPNFAYFVFDGFPTWTGSFTPTSADETFPATLMDDVASYKLIARSTDVINSQYSGGSDGVHMLGTFVYDGKVYDHIEFENRGEASTYVSGKNKWRIHFNRARRFEPRDNWGKKYDSSWTKLNLQPLSCPWAAVNRGMAGLDESAPFRLYELCGVPSPRTHYFTYRVIDSSIETHPTSQFEGDLWGLYLAAEQPNGAFLNDRNLPDGNVYKIEGGSGDKKEQGDTQVSDSSDWNAFSSASNSAQTVQWWRDNMHMPTYYTMRALNRYTGNVDIRIGYNHYFYHEPTQDQWHVIPWDLDMMYISETHQAGVIRQQNSILNHAILMREFRNRSRELLDLVGSDNSPTGGQYAQLVDEYVEIINPPGQALTLADLDAFLWNYHSRTNGNPNTHSGQTNHKGNFYYSPFTDSRFGGTYVRTLDSQDHEGLVKHIIDYTTDTFPGTTWSPGNGITKGYGYEYLKFEAADNQIPNRPTITYTGAAGHPVNDLSFTSSNFSDSTGSFGKMRWRVAQIAAPGLAGYIPGEPRIYEIETVFQSSDITSFNANYTFPADILVPGNTYRVRVQHEDSTARTSHWSEPIEFVAGTIDTSLWQNNLVISEIMYNPAAPTGAELNLDNDEFEFIEIKNISDTLTIDLSDLSFTDGITFDFATASITSLAPGECLVLVKNQAAFVSRYGTGLPIAGTYTGSLNNGGENVTLSYLVNSPVIDFTYDDDAPWPTGPDGSGVPLILADPSSAPDHALPASWIAGVTNGTPGTPEADCPTFSDWANTHFNAAQLADPDISGANADPDHDLLDNLLEYALGTNPLSADGNAITCSVVNIGGTNYLALTFTRLTCRNHLTYTVQTATDLQVWNDTNTTEISSTDNGDGTETVTVRSNTPYPSLAKEFIRLQVTTP